MKNLKSFIAIFILLLISVTCFPQDLRSPETKIADLLTQLPASDIALNNKLMEEMLSLGEAGVTRVCDQIIPAGTGDDTQPRFAIESLTRFVSRKGKETEREFWEKICIRFAVNQQEFGIKDFFMKQLQIIGSDKSVNAIKMYLENKDMCEPAVAVIVAARGKTAEAVLAEALKNKDLPCAASVLNGLANMNSRLAINEYILWSKNVDNDIKSSAYNALAKSGNSMAYPVLSEAAGAVLYKWDPTGATASLMNYATVIAENGDIENMDKICKTIISECDDETSIQNKTAALSIYMRFHGIDAMSDLISAASHKNPSYRNAAINMSMAIPGNEIVKKWIKFFPKAIAPAKPEIITMLGLRGDEMASALIIKSLSHKDFNVRKESAEAIVKIEGENAIPALIRYMRKFKGEEDQQVAKLALSTVAGSKEMALLVPLLEEGPSSARKTTIELLARTKENQYFSMVFPFTSSEDEPVRSAAFKALSKLAGPADQKKLISLLELTNSPGYIADIQSAIAIAANQIENPEKRSELLLIKLGYRRDASRLHNTLPLLESSDKNLALLQKSRKKIIPILAVTGGREALNFVTDEFKNGDPELQDVCFATLMMWSDYSASYALYDVCASGNKKYESDAFEGYVRQIKAADLPDEQKLLMFRKIMPFARSSEKQNKILGEIGNLKTNQALFFVANFLDDPSTSAVAANAAMNIALPSSNSNEGMVGGFVKYILIKATGKLTGSESDYEKERVTKYLTRMPAVEGFMPVFNGKDLTGWQGLVENPIERAKMSTAELAKKQLEADMKVAGNWSVRDACIWFNGSGDNLCTVKEYDDFEMTVDWKITKNGDSGIYLRGSPQVQIWDTSRVDAGAQVGSGGLYNNQVSPSKPLVVADNPVGEWNTFRILMIGEKVSVWLNGILVTDSITMENYWNRKIPIFTKGSIELQAHGTDLAFRDIFVREISEKGYNLTPAEKAEGFESIFNGRNLDNWVGNKESYIVDGGMIVIKPTKGSGGNLYTEKVYSDFNFRFEFQLTPGANNGLGIRTPLVGDAAYVGMELQILDNTAAVYNDLKPYQYHGSVYGVIPAKKGFLNSVGEWNYQEVIVKGTRIKVILNGTVILDGDIAAPRDTGTPDQNEHPGLHNSGGHIGFLGHGSELKFRNIRIKTL